MCASLNKVDKMEKNVILRHLVFFLLALVLMRKYCKQFGPVKKTLLFKTIRVKGQLFVDIIFVQNLNVFIFFTEEVEQDARRRVT